MTARIVAAATRSRFFLCASAGARDAPAQLAMRDQRGLSPPLSG